MSKPTKSLSWNDRLALINAYKPSDSAVCSAFGVSSDELQTARDLEQAGTFSPTKDLDVASYSQVFGAPTGAAVMGGVVKPKASQPAATATKKVVAPKKRGRKGSNIKTAFSAVPSTPVTATDFAKSHNVSIAVLRQGLRFDTTGLGKVRVKKDKTTKNLMIWREA